jgi:hypothetical protein
MNAQKLQLANEMLLRNIRAMLPQLEQLLGQANDHWTIEDGVYRFYHQSFKVFYLQEVTTRIVTSLRALAPNVELNPWFSEIVKEGTGREFDPLRTNNHWTEETRPVLEAFFHSHFFLTMICKYGRALKEAPQTLPSGWAAVLYLYQMR